jgi:antitoxin HigA-1
MSQRSLFSLSFGNILFEAIRYRLAESIRVPARRINEIVLEKRGITADTALRLSRFFGNSAQFWMNLQTRYELESARDLSAASIDREVRPHAAA